MVKTGRHRRWSEDEKLKIVLASLQALARSQARRGDTAFALVVAAMAAVVLLGAAG